MGSLYTDRLTRICPPRAGATNAGAPRAVACNATSQAIELDNDIFQNPLFNGAANVAQVPGSFGRALVEFEADGGDIYVTFGSTSGVVANSAATSGNTVAAHIPQGIAKNYELDPAVDKYVAAATKNGGSVSATLRYRIVSFPTNAGGPG